MFRPAAAASITGRVGRGAGHGRRTLCEGSMYRPSRGIARSSGESVGKSHGEKVNEELVVVVVAVQAASEQSRATTIATEAVGRIHTAVAAKNSESSPAPQFRIIIMKI